MTAERFTVDSDGKWWDKIKHEYVTLDSLFRLVEELDYTINEMAKTIRIYDDGYIDLNKKYKKLADENEQLKKQLKELKEDVPLLLAFYRWYPFAVEKKEHQAYNRLWDFVND